MSSNSIETKLLATDNASVNIKKLISNLNAVGRSVTLLDSKFKKLNASIAALNSTTSGSASFYKRLEGALTAVSTKAANTATSQKQLASSLTTVDKSARTSTKSMEFLGSSTKHAGNLANSSGLSFTKLVSSLVGGDLIVRAIVGSFHALASSLKAIGLHVGRVEEMGIVLENMGKTAGYSAATMQYYTERMQELGIVTDSAQTALTKMIRANFSLEKAMKLTRLAQDAAVISGKDSSETLAMLIHGTISLQPEVLRTYGVIVSLERAYKDWAIANNRTTQSLSGQEKQAIALNAVLGEAERIHGNYEAAMTSASKQMRSTTRYTKLLMEAFSDAALPVFREIVFSVNAAIKDMTGYLKNNQEAVQAVGVVLGSLVKLTFELAVGLEQALYYLGLSPRAWADMHASYNRASVAIDNLIKRLGGLTEEQIAMEGRIAKVNQLFEEQRSVIDSLVNSKDVKISRDLWQLREQYINGLIGEATLLKGLKALKESVALAETKAADAARVAATEKTQLLAQEEKSQSNLLKLRENLADRAKQLTLSEAEYAEWALRRKAAQQVEIVNQQEENAKKLEAIRQKEIDDNNKLLEIVRQRKAAQGITLHEIPKRPGKPEQDTPLSASEQAAKDRERIEKVLQLELTKLHSGGQEKRKTLIEHMTSVIEKAALTRIEIKAKEYKKEAQLAKEAGVDEEQIRAEFNAKIADLYAPRLKKQKDALKAEIVAAEKAHVDKETIAKFYNARLAAINAGVPTLDEFEQVEAPKPPSMEEFNKALAETAPGIQQDKTLLEEHQSREALIQEHYTKLLEMAKQTQESKLSIERVGVERKKALDLEQDAYDKARIEMKNANALRAAQELQSGLSALYDAGLAKNKTVFYAMKALSISEAIISANLAASKVVGQAGIGGIPLSALVYASAMARVAAIAAQQPGYAEGGIVTPYGSQGKSVTVAEKGPEAIIPLSGGRAVPVEMRGGGQQPIVNLTVQAIDTQSGIDFIMKNKSTIGNAILGASADNHPVRRR